jgi:predicted amidophosphoribosyltransferase
MSDDPTPEPGDRTVQALAFRALGNECSACRKELQPDWQFCAHCEARLATACPACGVALPPAGADHCGHCGLILLKPVDKA